MGDSVRLAALRATAGVVADLVRGCPHPRWRRFLAETWGHPRRSRRGRPVIWLVCAAGGEVVQARGLVPALREVLPDATLVLSTSNHAFFDVASRIPAIDACLYTPWDLHRPAARALDAIAPDLLVTVESAWNPELLQGARRRGIRTMLASGTMVADYHRAEAYRRPMRRRVLDALDVVGVKDAAEVEAFSALGVARSRIRVLGDLRLDPSFYAISDGARATLAARVGVRVSDRVLVAGSIHAGEEAVVLAATIGLRQALPGARIVVAPRFLSRVAAIEQACVAHGLTSRRLTASPGREPVDVVVVDTYGDLPGLYALARWVVLGGTFVQIGLGLGQNILEPLAHGVPVFFGPHVRRWTAITNACREIFPGLAVTDGPGLAQGIVSLEAAPEAVARLRARAAALMASGGDAAARHVTTMCELVGGAGVPVA